MHVSKTKRTLKKWHITGSWSYVFAFCGQGFLGCETSLRKVCYLRFCLRASPISFLLLIFNTVLQVAILEQNAEEDPQQRSHCSHQRQDLLTSDRASGALPFDFPSRGVRFLVNPRCAPESPGSDRTSYLSKYGQRWNSLATSFSIESFTFTRRSFIEIS